VVVNRQSGLPATRGGMRRDRTAPSGAEVGIVVGAGALALMITAAVVELARPQILLGLPATWFRPALYCLVILIIYWVRKWGLKAIWHDKLLVWHGLLVLMATAWVPFTVNNYSALQGAQTLAQYMLGATIPLSLFLVAAVRRRQFVWAWTLIHVYLAVYVFVTDGRGPGGIVQDENDMAFTLCMAIPYPYFLARQRGISAVRRSLLFGIAALFAGAIVWTHSRGGFLGLTCVAIYACYLSRHKVRNFLAFAILGLLALQFVPDSYVERIGTITDTEDTSRMGRLTAWEIGWDMFVDHPLVGVGPKNYAWRSGEYHVRMEEYVPGMPVFAGRAAHSLYFTIVPEFGLVGTTLFALIVIGMIRRLTASEKKLTPMALAQDGDAEADLLLAKAMKASIIGMLTTGTFISVLYYPQIWYTLGMVIAFTNAIGAEENPAPEQAKATNRTRRIA